MTEVLDTTKPYESLRSSIDQTSLKELRMLMNQSRGILIDENDVLKELNGNSYTPLRKYLEAIGARELYNPDIFNSVH